MPWSIWRKPFLRLSTKHDGNQAKNSFRIRSQVLLKDSLKNRAKLLKGLEAKSKELKKAQEISNKFNSEWADHQDLKGQVKGLQFALKKANNEDGGHTAAKMGHEKDMAHLKIRGKMLAFDRDMEEKKTLE